MQLPQAWRRSCPRRHSRRRGTCRRSCPACGSSASPRRPRRCARGRRSAHGRPRRPGRRRCSARRCACCRQCPRRPPSRCAHRRSTLCAICTRLSSLTPCSITVSCSAPRSMQVLAPISTSSPMSHRAELFDLLPAAVRRREAEAVGADDRAAVQDAARADAAALADHHLRGQARVRRRSRRARRHGIAARSTAPRADHRAARRRRPVHRRWPSHARGRPARPPRWGARPAARRCARAAPTTA